MVERTRTVVLALLILAALIAAATHMVWAQFTCPLPPAQSSPFPRYQAQDLTGIVAGVRRLAADIAWIQLLQYYGSPETPLDKESEYQLSLDMTRHLLGMPVHAEECHEAECADAGHHHAHSEGGVYPDLQKHCIRVVNLDPFFSYVYLYGAGALAWNQGRPQEAIDLLARGISAMERFSPDLTRDIHHPFWQLQLYVSAITYKQSGDTGRMLQLLETAARQPTAPNMIKVVLANIYQKDANVARALSLWLEVYESGDPSYRARAEAKIEELRKLLHLPQGV